MRKAGLLLLMLLFSALSHAGGVVVEGARLWAAPDSTRIVFDISAPVQHSLFSLKKPDRIVIDLSNAHLSKPLAGLDFSKGAVKDVRSAPRNGGKDLRLVLDLRHGVKPKSFVLKPGARYGNRLVIDLDDPGANNATKPTKTADPTPGKARNVVIAIDAGHGGEDPGATGPHGTHEKDVTLAIARRLAALVRKTPGMTPVLTRKGDYFVPLRKRTLIARQHKADLFISIHADAIKNGHAHGASVYALSQRGASSEQARWLAERENSSDLIGGVSLDDKDDLLASVLLDLSMTGTIEASLDLGHDVLAQLRKLGPVHKNRVNQAGFVVLKSPDIPSILVETAFISNPREERKLRSHSYQERMAQSIMRGVDAYLKQSPPPGTVLALKQHDRRHVITRGETLSSIAQHYDVSAREIKVANGLRDDDIQAGQVLTIPVSGSDS